MCLPGEGFLIIKARLKPGLFFARKGALRTFIHLDYNVLVDSVNFFSYSDYMAHRRSDIRNRINARRDAWRDFSIPVANLRLPRYTPARYIINDYRTFHPERSYRPLLRTSGARAVVFRPVQRANRSGRFSSRLHGPQTLLVQAPRKVLVCVRRRQRKEVLHALRKSGKFGQRKPRYNSRSQIYCS